MSIPSTEAPPTRRVKKRIYIPLILLALLLLAAVGFWVRGSWADRSEKNPATVDAGTITQLLQKANGNVVVRCAVVVDALPAEVWLTVTDYASHNKVLPYVSKVEAVKKDDGTVVIDGVAHSRLWGDWPFQSRVTQMEAPAQNEYAATWSEEDVDVFTVNRGGWTLAPSGDKQTLLAFTLQIELKDYPNFIVRNIIMDRLPIVVRAMRDEAVRRKAAK